MADTSKMTIIESGTEFDGTIKSQCGITLSGTLKGQISAPSLHVTATGSVNGKVNVAQLKAQGSVSGEIEAEAVELSGRVSDQTVIKAKTLEVMLTQPSGGLQVTFGNCELHVGEHKQASQGDKKGADAHRKEPTTEKNIVDTVSNLMK